ncbi:MAG: peroxiredoxin [Gammaproteobacteria bacterium]|nr:peroxiredoxin [Gammaproteobacteria bacterium]MBU1416356.1 peroxiredoxin [Gammaproteobacteria bacterium]
MKRLSAFLTSMLASSAFAALDVGDVAPDFSAQASLGGKEFTFRLSEALKAGPVVLYFYPAAFTQGCTVEAHNFAEAMPQYQALGASVIGVSTDDIETLDKFSVSECRGKFPVASDASRAIMKAYDAVLLWKTHYANRISYVIAPDGRIAYVYSAMNPDRHVENTLAAVKALVERGK